MQGNFARLVNFNINLQLALVPTVKKHLMHCGFNRKLTKYLASSQEIICS